jgi:outer membrane protein assembly factor BamC
MTLLRRLAVPAAVSLLLAGCSGFGLKSVDYKGAEARTARPLEVPPELSAPTTDDRYSVPDPRSQTSYSTYSQHTAAPAVAGAPAAASVLPKVEGVRIERAGDERWLVVKGTPDQVWPVLRKFWLDAGFTLSRESPEVGIMETDWHEDRSKIPQDFVRRTLGKVLDNLYSSPRRDRFRTRLEKGAAPGTTEVYVSDRAMEEIYTSQDPATTAWQPRPSDPGLEAEMLSRIMLKIGGEEAKTAVAAAGPSPGRPGAPAAAAPEARNAMLENGGAGPLVVNDGFDRAWRRVGLALDRVGFTVEDRDRSKGLFFVRYIDPEAETKSAGKKGYFDWLKFWRSEPKGPQPQYRILVSEAGASSSHVQVQDSKGAPEASSTGRKILGLLYDQLK